MKLKEDIETFQVVISEIDFQLINRVKALREEKDLSQGVLSRKMDFADGFVGKVEHPKERAKYNLRHLPLLAKALNEPIIKLLPEGMLTNDIIRITYRVSKKQPDNKKKDSGVKENKFEIIKIEPLTEEEIKLYNRRS